MFFTYLRSELRRRWLQTAAVVLGLAVGVSLVIVVTAASAGVQAAQGQVLNSLYGAPTQITVTAAAPQHAGHASDNLATSAKTFFAPFTRLTPRTYKCGQSTYELPKGTTVRADELVVGQSSDEPGLLASSSVSAIAKLPGVAGVGASLTGSDLQMTGTWGTANGRTQLPSVPDRGGIAGGLTADGSLGNWSFKTYSFQVSGVDPAHPDLGPLAAEKITSGRSLTASDASADVAVVDTSFAGPRGLKPGSTVTVAGTAFRVVGIADHPKGAIPAAVFIPLPAAQRLAQATVGVGAGKVNGIYVTADRASDIPQVRDEISKLLPGATVGSATDLTSQLSGSLALTSGLVGDLGKALTIVVLIVVFALACLLVLGAVGRRVREFGMLRALGWSRWRVAGQVLGEAAAQGILGGLLGVGIGVGAAQLISALAPPLSASIRLDPAGSQANGYEFLQTLGPTSAISRTVGALHLTAPVSGNVILLAVVLAVAGALIAGAFGAWRAARLRPAVALRQVA